MKCRFTETASAELAESVDYLIQHAPSVSGDFADSIDAAIAELLENPYSAQETELSGVRRKFVRRFRYALFYTIDEAKDELLILSVRHAARRWPWQP
jgi:plasmid stabilization system protein ParE